MKLALPLTCEVHELSEGFSAVVYDASGTRIADHLYEPQAAFIVASANSHDALVRALEQCRDNDMTRFNHHDPRRDGKKPGESDPPGSIWLTPREIATNALNRLAKDIAS